jgi:hypothetical protein
MPKKNKFIQFLHTAIEQTRFFILVTFYLDRGIKLVKHQRALMIGAFFNQWLQTAGNKYQSKKFPLTNSTEVINTSWNNYNSLSIQANNQIQLKNQYIKKLLFKVMDDGEII